MTIPSVKIIEPEPSLAPTASWHPEVYKPAEKFEEDVEWKAITKVVKARDKHACRSCGIKIGLTVHHILPREEGGTDFPPNLITLCKYCHDEIEEQGFKVKEQIIDFKRKRKYIKQDPRIVTNEAPIRWQQWVYGGYRNPQK
jgi:5-methylcytosine-specific restriction endonuclease McrA